MPPPENADDDDADDGTADEELSVTLATQPTAEIGRAQDRTGLWTLATALP